MSVSCRHGADNWSPLPSAALCPSEVSENLMTDSEEESILAAVHSRND